MEKIKKMPETLALNIEYEFIKHEFNMDILSLCIILKNLMTGKTKLLKAPVDKVIVFPENLKTGDKCIAREKSNHIIAFEICGK